MAYLVAVFGVLLYCALFFQFLTGRRTIQFRGKLHMKVHRFTGWVLVLAAPIHGLFAVHVFFGWPI